MPFSLSACLETIRAKLNPVGDGGGSQTTERFKGISTLVGAIFLHAVIGANQLINIVTYMTSYLRLYVRC